LGSNLNGRFKNIQKAIQAIHDKIGRVKKISSLYKTPAWGFKGNDFYNCCIEIETVLNPELLMKSLLDIEKQLGRKRRNDQNYENRIIDIDIVLYEEEIIDTPRLSIPHPKSTERKFVLIPLCEISSKLLFPHSKKTALEHLTNCTDKSEVELLPEKINLR